MHFEEHVISTLRKIVLNFPLEFPTRRQCLKVKRIAPLERAGKNLLIYVSFFSEGLKIRLRAHYTKPESARDHN